MYRNSRSAKRHMFSHQNGAHVPKSSSAGCATCAVSGREHACAPLACRNAFGAIAAGALLFVLRKALGTWNVPHLS